MEEVAPDIDIFAGMSSSPRPNVLDSSSALSSSGSQSDLCISFGCASSQNVTSLMVAQDNGTGSEACMPLQVSASEIGHETTLYPSSALTRDSEQMNDACTTEGQVENEIKDVDLEEEVSSPGLIGATKLLLEYDDQCATPPPSSSPSADSSQIVAMPSPIQQDRIEGKTVGEDNGIHSPAERRGVCGKLGDISGTAQVGKRKRSGSLPQTEKVSFPNPKRLTIKSQRLQNEKLKSPFRSPLLTQIEGLGREGASTPNSNSNNTAHRRIREAAQKIDSGKGVLGDSVTQVPRQRYRTSRAASQFKSPLSLSTAPNLGNMVRMTPDVQALERKLQVVKRALKIKEQNQEHALEQLAQKWTEAGREVAWELWSFVKDNGISETEMGRNSWSNENGWGWGELANKGTESELRPGCDDSLGAETIHNRGEDGKCPELATEGPSQNGLGMMLRQLGIDPKTLGWEEEENNFLNG